MSPPPAGAAPARYELRVRGVLDPSWSAWFEGLRVGSDQAGHTTIAGPVADQAPLHGLLAKVRGLGLERLEVRRLDPARWPDGGSNATTSHLHPAYPGPNGRGGPGCQAAAWPPTDPPRPAGGPPAAAGVRPARSMTP
jgi:hypothetical protein